MIGEAADAGCDVVLLPECLDLGWTHPSAKREALAVPGPYSERLANVARERGIFVCAGLTEKDGSAVYNTAVLIDDQGSMVLKYRKINVLDVAQEFYEVGTMLSVATTKLGKIGVNICSDNYPYALPIGHTLARMGAQIVLSPSSWTVDYDLTEERDPYRDKWIVPYSTLARLFGIVIAGATSVGYIVGGPYEGKKMVGCSLVVNEHGIVARGRYNEFASELIVAEFDVPTRTDKGTNIDKMLERRGYSFGWPKAQRDT
jgi:predicted amidohydrolase